MDNEILEFLKEFKKDVDKKFEGIDKKFEGIDKKFEGIDKKFEGIDKKFEGIDKKFEGIDKKFERIENKLEEHTQILRALEHLAEVNKAEHDKMSNDIAYIKGDIAALRKDLTNVEVITASNWADIAKLKAVK